MSNTVISISPIYPFKACVHYCLFFLLNDSPSNTMKNAFYFIQKALFVADLFKCLYLFPSFPFFFLSAIALEDDRR